MLASVRPAPLQVVGIALTLLGALGTYDLLADPERRLLPDVLSALIMFEGPTFAAIGVSALLTSSFTAHRRAVGICLIVLGVVAAIPIAVICLLDAASPAEEYGFLITMLLLLAGGPAIVALIAGVLMLRRRITTYPPWPASESSSESALS